MRIVVGMPAFDARSRPGLAFWERLAMTCVILALSWGGVLVVASMRACRFVPVPDIRTRIFGSCSADIPQSFQTSEN